MGSGTLETTSHGWRVLDDVRLVWCYEYTFGLAPDVPGVYFDAHPAGV